MKPGGSLRLAAAKLALNSVTIAPGDPGSAGISIHVSPVKLICSMSFAGLFMLLYVVYVVIICDAPST